MQHPFGSETSQHLSSADVTSILLSVFRDLKIATTVTILKFSYGNWGIGFKTSFREISKPFGFVLIRGRTGFLAKQVI